MQSNDETYPAGETGSRAGESGGNSALPVDAVIHL